VHINKGDIRMNNTKTSACDQVYNVENVEMLTTAMHYRDRKATILGLASRQGGVGS
jgi:hypothetical protein